MSIDTKVPLLSYVVNGLAFGFGCLTFNQWMMLISAVCGVGTFVVSWHYKRKDDKRKAELHDIEVQRAKGGLDE